MSPIIRITLLSALTATSVLLGSCSSAREPSEEVIPTPPLHTPRWAFRPWISKDISDTADTRAFVAGFKENDIPVGVVVLDSPWETNYNTFVPNPERYPGFAGLVSELRDEGIRTVLWVTQMVNESSFDVEPGGDVYDGASPNFDEGLDQDFFVNDGETYFWWKGFGAALDFFNPKAVAWWHAQQDLVLDMGIAGWKLDFGEQYVTTLPMKTAAGPKSLQEYSEEYYRDFLSYGVHKRGRDEFVTMVRPWDESYGFPGRFYARKEHAPIAWVGDNRRDWVGLIDALDHIFRSAQAGYLVVGSDIGGYLDRDDVAITTLVPADVDVFIRWTALGAMTPFMQLHGRANATPWTVPERVEDSVSAWRYWGWLHEALVPFFYSLSEEGIAGGPTIIRPIGASPDEWRDDWRYQLGDAFLVAPIIDSTGIRDVKLPEGARWYDWWQPEADPLAGDTTLVDYDVGDSTRIPVFVREGAIVPLDVVNAHTGLGTDASKGKLTVLVYPGADKSNFVLHDEDDKKTTIASEGKRITMSRALRATLFRVRSENDVEGVKLGGTALEERASREALDASASGYWNDPSVRSVWVKVPESSSEVVVELF